MKQFEPSETHIVLTAVETSEVPALIWVERSSSNRLPVLADEHAGFLHLHEAMEVKFSEIPPDEDFRL